MDIFDGPVTDMKGVTFVASTQVWHASAQCIGRMLPELKSFDEYIEGSMYNVLETIDSPPAPACPLCGPGPPAPLPSRILFRSALCCCPGR